MENDTIPVDSLEMLIDGAVNLSFGAFGLLANLLIVVSFIRAPRVRSEDCAYLIVCIAVADLLFCVSVIAQSVQNVLYPTGNAQAVHCLLTQLVAIFATATSTAFQGSFAIDRYEAACEPYDYQLNDHGKFAVYSLMVSCCLGGLVAVLFTSLQGQLAVLQTTSCPSTNEKIQMYWWIFETTAGLALLLLMLRAFVRMSVQTRYAESNGTTTVRAIAKQGRVTSVASAVVGVTVATILVPHISAFIFFINPTSQYFNRLVLYLGSLNAVGAALRPVVVVARYRAFRSHIGRVFRRHSANTAVGPQSMELFVVDKKDMRQSVVTLY